MRGLITGAVHVGMPADLAYFLIMIAFGVTITARRLDALLLR